MGFAAFFGFFLCANSLRSPYSRDVGLRPKSAPPSRVSTYGPATRIAAPGTGWLGGRPESQSMLMHHLHLQLRFPVRVAPRRSPTREQHAKATSPASLPPVVSWGRTWFSLKSCLMRHEASGKLLPCVAEFCYMKLTASLPPKIGRSPNRKLTFQPQGFRWELLVSG